MIQVDQVLVTAAPGDAVTSMALHTRDLLREAMSSEVYALNVHPDLEDVRPLWRMPSVVAGDRVLVYRSSIGDPEVTRILGRTHDPMVLVYHNITPGRFFSRWDPRLQQLLDWGRYELVLLRPKVVHAIADSEFNASELREVGYERITVVPVGVDPSRLLDLAPPRGGLPPTEGTIVLAVSQLLPHKRIDLLLQTTYVLEHHLQLNATMVIVGAPRTPRYFQALRAYERHLALSRVRFVGGVSDRILAELYRRAGVFVTVSEHEGFGVPPLEAMAFGVPVLARRCGALPETVADAGLLLDADVRATGVAEGIVELLHDRHLVEAITTRGYARASSFSKRASDTQLLDVLAGVV